MMKTTQATQPVVQTVPTPPIAPSGITKQSAKPRFSPELRERAVRLVYEQRNAYGSQWATIESVAGKVGCSPQTLDNWIKRRDIDNGKREGVMTDKRERIKALERENRELRHANEILKRASAFLHKLQLTNTSTAD
jgi:transposase